MSNVKYLDLVGKTIVDRFSNYLKSKSGNISDSDFIDFIIVENAKSYTLSQKVLEDNIESYKNFYRDYVNNYKSDSLEKMIYEKWVDGPRVFRIAESGFDNAFSQVKVILDFAFNDTSSYDILISCASDSKLSFISPFTKEKCDSTCFHILHGLSDTTLNSKLKFIKADIVDGVLACSSRFCLSVRKSSVNNPIDYVYGFMWHDGRFENITVDSLENTYDFKMQEGRSVIFKISDIDWNSDIASINNFASL